MARIMKVRTIPRGYVAMDDLAEVIREKCCKTAAEWFMSLYAKFGNPQEGGIWSYLLRHNGIVIKITAEDNENVSYNVWVASGFVLNAKRKRVKAVNVIARRMNEKDIPFVTDEGEKGLYYPIKKKNEELLRKISVEEAKKTVNDTLTREERGVLYGSLCQFMDDVKEEIDRTVKEIFDE